MPITEQLLLAVGFRIYGEDTARAEKTLAYHGEYGVLTVRIKEDVPFYWAEDGRSYPESVWPVDEAALRRVVELVGKVKT